MTMGLFTKTKVTVGESSLSVNADFVKLDIPFGEIKDIKLREDVDLGRLITGKKGGLAYQGVCKNDEFGTFDLLFNVTAHILIVVKYGDGKVFVFNGKSRQATEELYATIKQKASL